MCLISIPYFRDIIVYAFECPHCFTRTSDVQSANEIQELGCRLEVTIGDKQVRAAQSDHWTAATSPLRVSFHVGRSGILCVLLCVSKRDVCMCVGGGGLRVGAVT